MSKKQRDIELATQAVRTAKAKLNRLVKDGIVGRSDVRWIDANKQYDKALDALTNAQYAAKGR